MYNHLKRAIPAVIASALLAGCGQAALNTNAFTGDAAAFASLRGPGGPGGGQGGPGGMKGGHGAKGGPGGMMGLYGLADLTAEQKTQIQAIQAKYRPAKPATEARARPEHRVTELLEATTLDVEALKVALAERPTRPARPDHTAMLAEVRAVLTDAQRAAIITQLEGRTAPADQADADRPARPTAEERVAHVASKLSLSDEQKAALTAFEVAMEANRPEKIRPDFAARQAAELAFWKTGDTAALAALAPAEVSPPAFPVDAFVALAQVLTPEQRVQLLARGGHGGPGGPGGRGGQGGPGGHGGHGGHGFGGGQGGWGPGGPGFGATGPGAPAPAAEAAV